MATIEITQENFQAEVLESDRPVLVDCWAVWCGPCQMIAPVIDEIAREHPEIKVGKINTDEQPALAQQLHVVSIPQLFLFKGGQVAAKTVGAQPKEALERFITQ